MHNQSKSAFLGAVVMSLAGAIAVQAAPSISGYVDASYNANLGTPSANTTNFFHAYDGTAKTFNLNSAHLALSGSDSASGLGYLVSSDMGSDAALNEPFAATGLVDVQEAYLTYGFGPGKAWGLKAGKYVTYEGIEVIAAGSNPTFSRGFLYTLAEPVSHTGAEVSYAAGKVDVHVGLVNGWDQITDLNNLPTLVAKVGLNMGDPLALTLSTLIGTETAGGNTANMRMSYDLTGVTHAIKMVDLNFQGNIGMEPKASNLPSGGDATWFGFGVQPLVHVSDMFGIGLRYEYFDDLDGARTVAGAGAGAHQGVIPAALGVTPLVLQNVTLAPTFWLTKSLTARAEYRIDFADKNVFVNGNGNTSGVQMEVGGDLIASF
jgi:hypothetical protein